MWLHRMHQGCCGVIIPPPDLRPLKGQVRQISRTTVKPGTGLSSFNKRLARLFTGIFAEQFWRQQAGKPMSELILILVSAILVNNFVLVQFLGLCPFMGVSNKLESAMGMSMATTFVLTLASICSYLTYKYILLPLNLGFLKTISFILVIAVVVQFTEMVVRKTSPLLHKALGVFLPLITTNCAVLGVALLNTNRMDSSLVDSATYGFGAAAGFSLVLVLFSAMRERIAAADVPTPFRGAAIGMISAGLMSLAFMGFTGLIKL